MATYQSNVIKLAMPPITGTPYPKFTKGQVGAAPADVLAGNTLQVGDQIQLFKVSAPGGLFEYNIDIPVLDGSGGTLVMELTDGTNVLQSGITAGQTAAGRVTSASAAHGTLGDAVDYSATTLIYLQVTTAATNAVPANAQINFIAETQND